MASITKDVHQPPKTPFWIACFNGVGSDGRVRRFKRSTKTTDRKLAQKLADEWEALEKLAGEKRLTESQCRKVIAQMYERTVGEPLHFKTAREYLTEWVESKKNETELRARLKYDQIVTDFLAYIGVKADRLLREITPADIRSYRDALKRKGLAAPTVNHAIKILRMPFKAAHDAGYIDINPNTKNTVRPVKVTEPKPGVFIVDMGRNFAGWVTLRAQGPAGTRLDLRVLLPGVALQVNSEQGFLHDVLGIRIAFSGASEPAAGGCAQHRRQRLEQPLIGGRVAGIGPAHQAGPLGFAFPHARSCR